MDTMLLEYARLQRSVQPHAIVDPAPKNPFAEASTYRTANAAILAGHKRIHLAAGTHTNIVIPDGYDGVTIQGTGRETIVASVTQHAIEILGDYACVRDLSVQTTQGAGYTKHGVSIGSASVENFHVTVENVHVRSSDSSGIYIYHASVVMILNCQINNCDEYGIYMTATSGSSNQSAVLGNNVTGPFGAYPISSYNGGGHRIQGNDFAGASGYTADIGCNNTLFTGNRLYGQSGYAYALRTDGADNLFSDNIIQIYSTAAYYDTGSSNTFADNVHRAT